VTGRARAIFRFRISSVGAVAKLADERIPMSLRSVVR
jgi:hypothetical protein